VYALGTTLAYAATGYTMPEREELPPSLRSLVARCLARDPVNRPQLSEVVDGLASDGRQGPPVGFGPATFAETLLGPGWLPARVVAAIAHQSATVLAADVEVPARVDPAWPPPAAAPVSAATPPHRY
jgi:hypothetical protein